MAREWNPAQKEALAVRGRDTLVCAAAGSGKTAVLCQRILDRITDSEKPLELSRLLIVTFTNAAAAEMRSRLQSGINEALANNPSKHLRRQAMLLHRANICTIDKYCINFVKSHFHLLGVSPDVNVAEDSAISEIKLRVMQKNIDRFYKEEPDFAATSDLFVTDRNEKSFPSTLISLHQNLSSFASGTDAILEVAGEMEKAAEKDLFDSRWGEIIEKHFRQKLLFYKEQCQLVHARYATVPDENDQSTMAILQRYRLGLESALEALDPKKRPTASELVSDMENVDKLLDCLDRKDTEAFFAIIKNKIKYPRRTLLHHRFDDNFIEFGRERFKKDFASLQALDIQFDPNNLSNLYRRMAEHCRMIHRLIKCYENELMEEKKKRNLLEFSDMERMTLSLLEDKDGNPTALAMQLKEEYDEIFIDEYQDVNEIQNRIFTHLSSGNRFLVGDVKQSIYGFRYADPTIFSSLRASFDDYEKKDAPTCRIFMQSNYRCDKTVIDFTNTVCNYLFPHCSGMQYLPKDALSYAKAKGDKNEKVEIIITKPEDEEYECHFSSEAQALATRIKSLLGYRRPDQIAILCRSLRLDSVGELVEELHKYDIPVAVSGLSDFFEQPEILLTKAILEAVDNPTKDIPLAAVLRSPIFGFSDKELILLAKSKQESLWEKLKQAAKEGNEKANKVIQTLDSYRRLSVEEGPDALLFELYESPAFHAATSEVNKIEAQDRLDYLYGLSLGTDDLRTLLARLCRMEEEGIRDRKDQGQNENKVRIMTIHGAKGLEFDVCCLFGCGKYFNSKAAEDDDFDPLLGPAFSLKDESGLAKLATAQQTARKLAGQNKDLDEEMRILYVALTRARNHLIITGTPKTAKIDTFVNRCRYYATFDNRRVLAENPSYLAWILIALYHSGNFMDFYDKEYDYIDGCKRKRSDVYSIFMNSFVGDEILEGETDEELSKHFDLSDDDPSDDDLPNDNKAYSKGEAKKIEEKIKQRQSFRYPHEIACQIPAKLSVSTLKEDFLEDAVGEALLRSDSAITLKTPKFLSTKTENLSARKGSATHAVMQFCDFANAEEMGAKAEIERLCKLGFLSAADADLADADAIDRFFQSNLYKEIQNAKKIWRERRFMITLPAESFTKDEGAVGEELLVQGVIDCFFTDKEGRIWLVDYKTDRFPEDTPEETVTKELQSRHGEQMRYYKQAIKRLCGQEVYQTLLYSFHLNKAIALTDDIGKETT